MKKLFQRIIADLCNKSDVLTSGIENTIDIKNNKGDIIGSGNITINNYYGKISQEHYLPFYVERTTQSLTKQDLDNQTVLNLFTYFSTDLMDNYLHQNPGNIDSRIVLICDYWDAMINASSFKIYNPMTDKAIRDFYEPFSRLIHEGGMYYGPHDINPQMYHFFGYEHDAFISREKEKKFYEFADRISQLQPLYKIMMDHIKNEYPLNLVKLSEEFQKANN